MNHPSWLIPTLRLKRHICAGFYRQQYFNLGIAYSSQNHLPPLIIQYFFSLQSPITLTDKKSRDFLIVSRDNLLLSKSYKQNMPQCPEI